MSVGKKRVEPNWLSKHTGSPQRLVLLSCSTLAVYWLSLAAAANLFDSAKVVKELLLASREAAVRRRRPIHAHSCWTC